MNDETDDDDARTLYQIYLDDYDATVPPNCPACCPKRASKRRRARARGGARALKPPLADKREANLAALAAEVNALAQREQEQLEYMERLDQRILALEEEV